MGYPTILIPGLQGKSVDNSTYIELDFVLTDEEISWIGSITMLCVPVGSLTSGLLMEPLGKRRMMQVCVCVCVSSLKILLLKTLLRDKMSTSIQTQLQCFIVSINLSFALPFDILV